MVAASVAASNLPDLDPIVCAANTAISPRREGQNARPRCSFKKGSSRKLICHTISMNLTTRPSKGIEPRVNWLLKPMPTRILALILILSATVFAQPADLILYNAKIVTVDPQFHVASSIAIRADRITAVGPRQAVAKFAGPLTRQIDLKGKTVLPGLMDSHVHASEAAMYEFDHPVPEMETVADVLTYLKSRTAVAKPGEWIVLRQVFITRLRDQRFPTRAELDAAAPRNPVYFGTGPDASVNSMALSLSGIDKNFRMLGKIFRQTILHSTQKFLR